jgi:hypothetical protein
LGDDVDGKSSSAFKDVFSIRPRVALMRRAQKKKETRARPNDLTTATIFFSEQKKKVFCGKKKGE